MYSSLEKIPLQPIESGNGLKPRKSNFFSLKNRKFLILSGILAFIVGLFFAFLIWFNYELSPVDKNVTDTVKVQIESSTASSDIAAKLKESGLIRSEIAFMVYLKLSNQASKLHSGVYQFAPSSSAFDIVKKLVDGASDQIEITFYPGSTLVDNTDTDSTKKTDVTSVLLKAGYSNLEIEAALAKTYDSPLFDSKPTTADLEGYIYGETYRFDAGTSVEDILSTAFAEYYKVIQENNLVELFSENGLTLYQGITLASIIQREVNSAEDQKQVAQVFYKRLENGMVLGSDVTYQYITDKLGVARDPDYDSPYNTRVYAGLTPGPISNPGLSALLAVANPASGDYLYFLSGDDDVTYFANTYAEHEYNIENHCQIKCSTL